MAGYGYENQNLNRKINSDTLRTDIYIYSLPHKKGVTVSIEKAAQYGASDRQSTQKKLTHNVHWICHIRNDVIWTKHVHCSIDKLIAGSSWKRNTTSGLL